MSITLPNATAVRHRIVQGHGWWALASLALLLSSALAAATCQKASGGGFGLIEFGGRAGSAALDDPVALGINPLYTWAELEPTPGGYDWAPVDAALASASAKGKRVVPRVYTNVGDFDQATPDWVFDAGAQSYAFGEGSDTRQPVPTDAVFAQAFAGFLAAFGARYNGNPAIEFIQTNAGMGGYGEMVWSYGASEKPPGWSPRVEIDTIATWVDRWRAAFPDTNLALTFNPIEPGIAETATRYAVDRRFFLQANSVDQSPAALAIFRENAGRTHVVMEIEDNGCGNAAGAGLDSIIGQVFGYGIPIDYASVCSATFGDSERARGLLERLRKDAPSGE